MTIKLGTLAPQGSTWHDLLKEMAQRWEQASGGQVKLRIYAGGAQGSEGDMVRKMAIGQLQAAAITNVGMHDVIPEPQVFSVPFLFDDEAQMECAFEKMRPKLDEALAKRGLVALQWSRVGSIYLFCDAPRRTPGRHEERQGVGLGGRPEERRGVPRRRALPRRPLRHGHRPVAADRHDRLRAERPALRPHRPLLREGEPHDGRALELHGRRDRRAQGDVGEDRADLRAKLVAIAARARRGRWTPRCGGSTPTP